MGAGYILSWNLVRWLEKDGNRAYMNWNEDQGVGEMLQEGKLPLNFVDLGEQVMDHPSEHTSWQREYGPDVIIVHRLKNVFLQADAIEYFFGDRDRANTTTAV
jgi:hypothetical protein